MCLKSVFDCLLFDVKVKNFSDVQRSRVEQIIISLKPFLLSRGSSGGRVIYDIVLGLDNNCGKQPFSVVFTNDVSIVSRVDNHILQGC